VPGELAIVTRRLTKTYYRVYWGRLALVFLVGAALLGLAGGLIGLSAGMLGVAVGSVIGVLAGGVGGCLLFMRFWYRRVVTAVKNLNLTVNRGEVFGLLGPNGSGKSTTIKLLLGLIRPSSGHMEVLDRPPGHISAKQRIGYLPEETHLYRFLNAEETLDFYGRLFRIPRKQRKQRVRQLLETVGLSGEVRRRPLRTYSKGQLRRIGLAQALINDPELLFLDEPTSGLDPIGRIEMKRIIADLRARGRTVFISSHLLADVEAVCDRVMILFQGETAVVGRTEHLLADEQSYQLTASGVDESVIAEVADLIRARGGEVGGTEHPRSSLEEFFRETIDRRRAAARGEAGTAAGEPGRSGT
jgi:ABC-2 type transport system ATP-binding protein